MSIQRPTAALSLDGGQALTLAQAAVRRLRVDLSVDEGHDRIELHLWADSRLATAAPGAKLAVGIGDGDDLTDVLTAEVAGVDLVPSGAVLTAFAPSRRLSTSYVGQSYVDSTVADVVTDLLDKSTVDAGDIDADLRLPVLHVDPRRCVWGHLHALARRTGHQITSTDAGAVSYTPIRAGTGDELRRGAELVAFRARPRAAAHTPPTVTPSGGSGPKWHLLAAEPDDGSTTTLVDPALRTREAADAATQAAQDAAARHGRTARVTVPGRPVLRAGTTATVLDTEHRILGVRHLLDPGTGYRCDLTLEAAP